MHPRLFPNGFQYFVKRTVQREGIQPIVIQVARFGEFRPPFTVVASMRVATQASRTCSSQNNWIMGAENKRHRFREAQLWHQDPQRYYTGTREAPLRLLKYQDQQPGVSGLLFEASALRSALR